MRYIMSTTLNNAIEQLLPSNDLQIIIWQMIHCADYDFCEYIWILMKHLKRFICRSPCLAVIYVNLSEALTLDRNIY